KTMVIYAFCIIQGRFKSPGIRHMVSLPGICRTVIRTAFIVLAPIPGRTIISIIPGVPLVRSENSDGHTFYNLIAHLGITGKSYLVTFVDTVLVLREGI